MGLTIFALACAERGSGIVDKLADEEEREWFSRILDQAWGAPSGEVNEDELVQVVEEFQESEDSLDPDEPYRKDFYVVNSTMLAVTAIAVHLNPSAARAEMSGQTLETVLSDFDFRLSGKRSVIVRAGEAGPPAGQLQQMEQDAQSSTMQMLATLADKAQVTRDFLNDVRESCRPVRDEIASATVAVAELAGWETGSPPRQERRDHTTDQPWSLRCR